MSSSDLSRRSSPTVALSSARLFKGRKYTLSLRVPRHRTATTTTTKDDAITALSSATCHPAGDRVSFGPLTCPKCGPILVASAESLRCSTAADDDEEEEEEDAYQIEMMVHCSSSRRHLGSRLVVRVDMPGGVTLVTGSFAILARDRSATRHGIRGGGTTDRNSGEYDDGSSSPEMTISSPVLAVAAAAPPPPPSPPQQQVYTMMRMFKNEMIDEGTLGQLLGEFVSQAMAAVPGTRFLSFFPKEEGLLYCVGTFNSVAEASTVDMLLFTWAQDLLAQGVLAHVAGFSSW